MLDFWLCFVPLFVAVDPVGILPIFLALTEGLDTPRVRKVIWQSLATGMVVAVFFVAIGRVVFRLLGITPYDFMVAGGSLLFAFSLRDLLLVSKAADRSDPESLGAVPIGVPLIVGPAVLTTILLLLDAHGILMTTVATVTNILIAGVVFWFSPYIVRLLGHSGAKTVSKLTSLLLAAIAVMMVRRGLQHLMSP